MQRTGGVCGGRVADCAALSLAASCRCSARSTWRLLVLLLGLCCCCCEPSQPTTNQARLAAQYNNIGAGLLRAGNLLQAAQNFKTAVKLDPGLAVSWENLGHALMRAGQGTHAKQAWGMAARLPRENKLQEAAVYNNIGLALNGEGQECLAADWFSRGARLVLPTQGWEVHKPGEN